MRFHLGAIPLSPDFVIDGSWKPLRELSPIVAQVAAFPLAILAPLLLSFLYLHLTPISAAFSKFENLPSGGKLILSFVLLIILHEFAHMLAHPMSGRSSRSVIGFWPMTLIFYAHYDGEMSRNRFIAILLMPLFVLSIVPLLVMAATQMASPLIAILSVANSSFACLDMFGVGLLLFQIPRRAIIRNQGWRTYWKTI